MEGEKDKRKRIKRGREEIINSIRGREGGREGDRGREVGKRGREERVVVSPVGMW